MATFNKPQFNSVWATSGAKVAPDAAKINLGWVVEIPPHELDNWIRNRQDALLAHINQMGVVAWDETVEYQANKSYVQGSTTGNVYRAVTTHTGINPETDVNGNWQIAFERGGTALLKSQNLADVPDKALARANLGIPTTADYDGRYLQRSQNLADVPNKSAARANLGLGGSAVLNVGTTSGTVAAGDDARIVNAVQTSRTITAGNGLTGGGTLGVDRTISLGTPSTITATSGNSAGVGTHSHSIDMNSLVALLGGSENFQFRLGDLIIKFGTTGFVGGNNTLQTSQYYGGSFPSECLFVLCSTKTSQSSGRGAQRHVQFVSKTRSNFQWFSDQMEEGTAYPVACQYIAVGR